MFHCSFSEYIYCLPNAINLHFVMIGSKSSLTKNESVKLLPSLSSSHPQLQMAPAGVHADWCWFEISFIEKTAKKH